MADIPFVKPESTKSKTFAFDGLSSGKTPQSFKVVKVVRKREKRASNG